MSQQDIVEKIPPHSIEAEMAVLGSMLIDHDSISSAIEILKEAYFYKDAHRKIFSAVVKLFDQNKGVDIITLIEELKKAGSLDEVGGPAYVTALSSSVPTAANFLHYAKIVKEKMLVRNLLGVQIKI